jgi:predicted aminopeptidase
MSGGLGRLFLLAASAVTLTGCSPGYVLRAAYEQGKILYARTPIEDVLNNPDLPADDRRKLSLVLEARAFAESIGLEPKGSFRKFASVDRDPLAWIVMGAKKDSFSLTSWWFPIVGSVPYKGYFERDDAEAAARDLEGQGFETWVRPTDAFSTLGWFNDPVLSTTLKHPDHRIVNTVIHESVHSTVWIPGSVPFNESLANFVGNQGATQFYQRKLARCQIDCDRVKADLERCEKEEQLDDVMGHTLETLHARLDALYKQKLEFEKTLKERVLIFDSATAPLKEQYPTLTILQKVNNAEIMQLRIYMMEQPSFRALYKLSASDWPTFLKRVEEIAKDSQGGTPFERLKKSVATD